MILPHLYSVKLSDLSLPRRLLQLIEEGSQNVYADLGCANADAMQRKAILIVRISDVTSAKGLELAQASAVMGIEALCLESWLKGRFREADEAVLHTCLRNLEMQPH